MSAPNIGMERRRHPRTSIEMDLQGVRLDPDGGHVIDSIRMVDISKGGLGVMSSRPYYPGQRVLLSIPTSKTGQKRLATVVRCRATDSGYRVGMAFDGTAAATWYDAGFAVAAAA